jgi:SulP family sulfate permease
MGKPRVNTPQHQDIPYVASSAPASWTPYRYWRTRVTAKNLRLDLLAALTTAVIALPQGVAYALVAGLPAEYGLYTAIVPVIIAALFGSSRHIVCGPTTPLALLVFTTVTPLAAAGSADYVTLTLTLTFLVGLYQLILGLARLGTLANLISHSVIVGFSAGSAILIIESQLDEALGITTPSNGSLFSSLTDFGGLWSHINAATLAVAVITLATAVGFNRFRPRWPALLIAMVTGSLTAAALGGADKGIAFLGSLPSSLPPLSFPDLTPSSVQPLLSGALAIALVGLVEAISIARSIAHQSGQRINPNQEFFGQGLSNIAGSVFASFPSSASFARSNLNFQAGAQTPLAAVASSGIVLLSLVALAPLTRYIPLASLAGVLLLVGYKLIDTHHIRIIFKTSRQETAVFLTTFLACVFVALDFGIYVGIILSLLLHLNRISHPRLTRILPHSTDPRRRFAAAEAGRACPQLNVVTVDGSLFFGSVSHVDDGLRSLERAAPQQHFLLLNCSSVNFIDINGAQFLAEEAARRRDAGGRLFLCAVKTNVIELLERSGYLANIGAENIFPSKEDALGAILPRLDAEICSRCQTRVFEECQDLPGPFREP